MNNSYTIRFDISKYTIETSKDYIGVFNTVQLLQEAINSLSIDLRDQFCVCQEFINVPNKTRIILITASDKFLVDEVIYQFENNVKRHNLTLLSKHFMKDDYYSLGA